MSFLYLLLVKGMTIYVDGLFFLNYFFDFLILLSTVVILNRNVSFFRICLGAFVGSLSILVLFLRINSIELFLIKFYLGFLMCIVCFGFHNIKSFLISFSFLFVVSLFLGGILYYLNLEFSYGHKGLLFFNKGFSINILFLIFTTPICLFFYVRQIKGFKVKYVNFYKVDIYFDDICLSLNGYLDSGNLLRHKGKFVIITNIKNTFNKDEVFIAYNTVNGLGVLRCILADKVVVFGLGEFYNVYLGFSNSMNSLGCDVLLNGGMIC